MDELVAEVLRLDGLRQAVFRTALAEQAQPILASSKDYQYAVRAMELCWRWIEYRDVAGDTLYDAYCNDEDFGVAPSMLIAFDYDPFMGHAWGCIVGAVAYVAYCAFMEEGAPVPEDVKNDFPDEIVAWVVEHYYAAVESSSVPELLAGWLKEAVDNQLTQSIANTKLEEWCVSDSALGGAK